MAQSRRPLEFGDCDEEMTDDHNTPCEDVLRNALMNQIGGLSATRKVSGSTPRISPDKGEVGGSSPPRPTIQSREPAAERTAHSGSGKTPGGRPSKPGPVSRSIGTTLQPVHRRDSLSTGHSSAGSGHGRNFAYHNAGGSKELDGCRMARNRSESSIPCN